MYGDNALIGSLTPFIHPHILANNCILDGEIMVYDLQEQTFVTKAEGKDARKMVDTSRFVPSFIAYDIVYLDSQNLTLTSLTERRAILEKVVRPVHGYLSMSRFTSCSTKAAVLDLLNEAIERGEEGLVVKSSASIYTPDKRIDGGWFKIKTDYLGLMNDTVDVVIVGGFYGKHTASGKIRNFLCALKSDNNTWITFCKVSSGITKHDLENKLSQLEPFWKKFDSSYLPACVIMGREKPHVVIDPTHSLVLEIRGAELMNSTHFGLPLTLRFPRVVCVRDDKLPEDCTQVSELEAMRTQNKRGVAKVGSHNISPRKKQKIEVKPKIEVKSSGLLNKLFCVLSASESVTKELAETFIKEHSGEIVCTPIPGSTVLCGRQSVSVKNIIKQGKHVVQDIAWIGYCNDKLRPCPPRLMLYCPADMRSLVLGGFDEHGDSFTEPVTVDELHQIIGAMATDIPDDGDDTSLRRYPQFADFWRFALSDMVLWTQQRCAISYTAEMYGAQVTTDSNCPLVTHRLEAGDEGVGKQISRSDLLDIIEPFISQELYTRFSQR